LVRVWWLARPSCAAACDVARGLARLYTDEAARDAFLADARREATAAGLGPEDVERLCAIDRAGLVLAARSFARQRSRKG
jgi:hypothetical protein